MAIQHRRGSYNNFDPSRLLPGEWAIVTSDDDNVPDGKAVYICFASGDVKRLTTAEDMTAFTEYIEQVADEAKEAVDAVEQAIIGLIPTMSANIKGGAKLGNGLSVTDDVLSVDSSAIEIPSATTSRAGVVKPDGTSITVDSDGTIHGQAGGVTGVKGNSESSYRTGQVNLTPGNIGAAASSHVHSAADITSGALSMTYGGTGASGESQARANLGSMPMFICDTAASDATKIIYTSSLAPRMYNGARFLVRFTNGNTNSANLRLQYSDSLSVGVKIDGQNASATNPLDLDAGDIAEFAVYQSSTSMFGAHYLGKITDRKAIDGGAAGTLADAEDAITDLTADVDALRDSVGQYYSAAWTASSSASTNIALTKNITLPAGTYVVCMMLPVISTSQYFVGLNDTSHNPIANYCFHSGIGQSSKTVIVKLSASKTMRIESGQSSACTFSYLERGGLVAVRII